MSNLIDRICAHAARRPAAIALVGSERRLSYGELWAEIATAASLLKCRCLGLLIDNDPAWVIADLAAQLTTTPCVPLPAFFSDRQLSHALQDAGVGLLLTDNPVRAKRIGASEAGTAVVIGGRPLTLYRLDSGAVATPELAGVAKVTYTSGTTGTPKGVCLATEALARVTESLRSSVDATPRDVSLSLLPLSTLLENIGGVYVPLTAGGTATVPGLQATGLEGSSRLDLDRLVAALQHYQPSSVILVPQLLQSLVEIAEMGTPLSARLRMAFVGGAPVSRQLLRRANQTGLPVFEGYGLSEACSVASLNTPGAARLGSAGRPLPHVSLSFSDEGEILVSGTLFRGYLGESLTTPRKWWPTGDLGYLDSAGYLHLTGRKKHIFITAFGRNVAPEWVERELVLAPPIAQAVVWGEGKPYNVAVIVPTRQSTHPALEEAVRATNRGLPDYARVERFVVAAEPFTVANDQLTATGRPRRAAILERYRDALQRLYDEERV